MLKNLRIFNLILVEEAEITFHKGLNAITGETGSGKSAIMHALSLITGARADSGIVRKGNEKGSVEALFEGPFSAFIKQKLDNAGIDCDDDLSLIIRRDIFSNGKSRAFVNNQLVQISLLKTIGKFLVEIVSQHASHYLLSLEAHREILDLYGNLENEFAIFSTSWEKENSLKRDLHRLINSESERLRERENCIRELEELQEAQLKEGEEEELYAEYTLLVSSEDLAQKSSELLHSLTNEKYSLVQQLHRQRQLLAEIAAIDHSLNPTLEAFSTATIEIQEIIYTITAYANKVECNPDRCEQLNHRLKLINHLKRKYGNSVQEILSYQEKLLKRLAEIENSDTTIESLKTNLDHLTNENDKLASDITAKRKKVALRLEKLIIAELQSLNMPKAQFQVEIHKQARCSTGDDLVEFYLVPNVGEGKIPIRECASGGELSRLLLAFHVVLAGKEEIPTLVFDEIDEGIGGTTANLVGEKLKALGNTHQILCITHFHQVAKLATFHLQISKTEKAGRTATRVQVLDASSRQRELARMLGE